MKLHLVLLDTVEFFMCCRPFRDYCFKCAIKFKPKNCSSRSAARTLNFHYSGNLRVRTRKLRTCKPQFFSFIPIKTRTYLAQKMKTGSYFPKSSFGDAELG